MQTLEGYVEGGRFYPMENKIQAPGRCRAFLMILDEQAAPRKPIDSEAFWRDLGRMSEEIDSEDKRLRADWLNRLGAAIDLSSDEELPNFTRSSLMREPANLADEG